MASENFTCIQCKRRQHQTSSGYRGPRGQVCKSCIAELNYRFDRLNQAVEKTLEDMSWKGGRPTSTQSRVA